ncbi:MAG: M28 family peptidase [Candidatus Aminicenantes bacterium]|nr:MAG: M28 family peptidase [Candidatus Aminicenantes bacterium]
MSETMTIRSMITASCCAVLFGLGVATAGDNSLLRIERSSPADRNALIEAGVTLVTEIDDAFLAVGSADDVQSAAASRSLSMTVIDAAADSAGFALAGLRPGFTATALLVCGEVVAAGDDWRLVKGADFTTPECLESPGWFLRVLDMKPLATARPAPSEYAGLIDGKTRLIPNPLVQEMVDSVDTPFALAHWSALSQSPTWSTRHSQSQGCLDATAYVHGLFSSLGLETSYQHHTGGYADNVIGTITGSVEPEKTYIAIGHLDDLPSSGVAPGADDNASGTAMVTALAEIMSDYCFARTTRFIAVTGEEQGLYGSDFYADAAAAAGENIQAVLNGDMIGWQGNGQPTVEDLDLNYNSGSQWLAQAMVDAAADYTTGLEINAFLCSSMVYSDHAPFWSNGFSAICGITDNEGFCNQNGNYPYYHQSSDTIANCGPGGPDFEAAVIRTYLATMAHLAQPIARVPDSPSNIGAQPDGANRIALNWSDQGPGVNYRVFRSTGSCSNPGPPALVGETGSTSFVDMTVSGGVPYAYTLSAIVAGSCVSQLSNCVEATTTGSCDEPPIFAGIDHLASAGESTCRIDLGWLPPQAVWCGGPVAYNIYRSSTPGFTPSAVNRIATQISSTTFNDTDVVFSEDFHYIVRAVDLAHGGEDSNTHELGSSPTGPPVIGTWADNAGDSGTAALALTSPWHVAAGAGLNGAAYATGTYGNYLCSALSTPALQLDTDPQMVFWTKYEIENSYDKGELQVSIDGGSNWIRVPMTYPGSSSHTYDECDLGTGSFFTGNLPTYTQFTASLTPWAGLEVMLRWELSSDSGVVGSGWWIDEISITDVAVPGTCSGADSLFSDGFESGDTSAWSP